MKSFIVLVRRTTIEAVSMVVNAEDEEAAKKIGLGQATTNQHTWTFVNALHAVDCPGEVAAGVSAGPPPDERKERKTVAEKRLPGTCDWPSGTHAREECGNALPCPIHGGKKL